MLSLLFPLLLSITLTHSLPLSPLQLPPTTPLPADASSHAPCLLPTLLLPLATSWLSLFSTSGLTPDSLPTIATEDIKYWNEEFTYATAPAPLASGRAELEAVIRGSEGWGVCTGVKFEIVSVWGSCDRVAIRWRQRCDAVGGKGTAEQGAPIVFSGIDLLVIDLVDLKVASAETSSDRMNYYQQLGIDPFAGTKT